uniref:Uncharacterized protein n=1 Tax=Plectus sambesii TaxID=2011161 RepID=A0A914XFS5_9BILA
MTGVDSVIKRHGYRLVHSLADLLPSEASGANKCRHARRSARVLEAPSPCAASAPLTSASTSGTSGKLTPVMMICFVLPCKVHICLGPHESKVLWRVGKRRRLSRLIEQLWSPPKKTFARIIRIRQ